jgi:hypothetical protein
MHLFELLTNPAIIGTTALFLSVVWMLRDQTDRTRPMLVFALTLNLFFGFLLHIFMGKEGGMLPWKYDPVLYNMDRVLGVSAAAVARPLQGLPRIPLIVTYQLMVPVMIAWFFVTRSGNPRASIIMAYVAELVAAPLLYGIFPACGPIYAFASQWLNPPQMQAGAMKLIAMPNAFPSLHIGTAFIFVLLAPGKLWRCVSLAFLAATGFATLSTGEHYIVDLIAGLAFGCFAASIAYRNFRRAFVYLAIVLIWSLSLRFAYPVLIDHPMLPRAMALITLAIAILAVIRAWRLPLPQRAELATEAF